MTHPVQRALTQAPDAVLLCNQGQETTSVELARAVRACAGGLLEAGVVPGSTVALHGPASVDWLVALHAISWMGGIPAPLAADQALEPQLRTVSPSAVLTLEPEAAILTLPLGLRGAPEVDPHPHTPESTALTLTTSGTTGTARAVHLSWQQLDSAAKASQARLGHRDDDAWLGCLPLHHIGGLSVFLRTVRTQTTGVLHTCFSAEQVGAALDSGEVSQVSLVPSMLRAILDARPERPMHPRLRVLLIGGAPMPPDLLDRCRALMLPLSLSWGMSETAAQVATREPGDLRAAPDVGLPLAGLRVHTEQGMLVISGPTAPGGRWVSPDRGELDSEGRVVVFGRGTDLIISGGENIDPAEVELALEKHPAVHSAAVIGRKQARWGQRPVAYLVPSGPERPSIEALRSYLSTMLPPFKRPDSVHWLSELPRGPLGKLRRSVLRDQVQALEGIKEG